MFQTSKTKTRARKSQFDDEDMSSSRRKAKKGDTYQRREKHNKRNWDKQTELY